MSFQSVCTRIVSKARKAPNIILRRFHYRWQPKALLWSYLRKCHPGRPLILTLGTDLKVRVYPKDVLGRYIFIDGVFEPECWDFVRDFVRPGMIVCDLGANLGQYTLLAARCVGEHGRVHSFEPSRRIFSELEFNVRLNGLSERCTLNRLAISDTTGTARLSRYEEGAEVYGSLGTHRRSEAHVVGYEDVRTMRLDDYLEENGIDRVDFIKMDIEGAELLALKGAERLLMRKNAPTILLEAGDMNTAGFGYKSAGIWDYLESLGYRISCLDSRTGALRETKRPMDLRLTMNLVASQEKRVCR